MADNGKYFSIRPIKILFADDDPDVQSLVSLILNQAGMDIVCAGDGNQVIDLWCKSSFDLIILDIMMPWMDGLEALRRIRKISDIPVVLLSAKGMEHEIVQGFEAGADDYIIKPFRQHELIARLHAVLYRMQRKASPADGQIKFDDIVLDTCAHQVKYREKTVEVTPQEFHLLKYLMQNSGIVLSKEDLLRNVWGYSQSTVNTRGDLNLIEAAIGRLRKKIEMDPSQPRVIQTIWGAGYRFGA
jgi:DNA-binding response OmpR family regulator